MIGPGSDKNVGNFQQKMDTSTRFQFGWQEKQIGALSLRNIAFAGEGGGSFPCHTKGNPLMESDICF